MEDEPIVISSAFTVTPDAISGRTFATGFRGFDQTEVKTFLAKVSDELSRAAEREAQLLHRLKVAEDRVANPEIDESILLAALGDHAARLLASAREQAAAIRGEAEHKSSRAVREAEAHVGRARTEADSLLSRRVEEVDAIAAGLRSTAEAEARALRDQARAEADNEIQAARSQGREMVAEAKAVRERMLTDLTRRRQIAQVQLDQLRAARDRLLDAYAVVRRTLEEATDELAASDAEARLAAEEVGRRSASRIPALPVDQPVSASAHSLRGPVEAPSAPSPLVAASDRLSLAARSLDDLTRLTLAPPALDAARRAVMMVASPPVAPAEDAATVEPRAEGASRLGKPVPSTRPLSALTPRSSEPEPGPVEAPGSDREEGDGQSPAPTASVTALPSAAEGDRSRPSSRSWRRPGDALEATPLSPASTPPTATSLTAGPPIAGPQAAAPSAAPVRHLEPVADAPATKVGGPGADDRATPDPPAGESTAARVDELFARIKAGRAQDQGGNRTPKVGPDAGLAPQSPPTPTSTRRPIDAPARPAAPEHRAEPAATTEPAGPEPAATATGPTSTGPTEPAATRPEATAGSPPPGDVDDERARAWRDELLEGAEEALARAVKRALQDEQNEVLDRLRQDRNPTPESVLGDRAGRIRRLVQAASPALAEAAAAGVRFGSPSASPRDGKRDPRAVEATSAATLIPRAEALAAEIADPLHDRLARALPTDGDVTAAVDAMDAVSAIYRQWRTQDAERVARQHAIVTFSAAAYAVVADGTEQRWVVDDDGPCPDCDDNVLAETVAKGEPFPTGQFHPPAHAGCRCLLVAAVP